MVIIVKNNAQKTYSGTLSINRKTNAKGIDRRFDILVSSWKYFILPSAKTSVDMGGNRHPKVLVNNMIATKV
ncbi:hypothetical protein EVA_10674 [gut metagenome]|uniref:Uncharacterized protein n=1 Tax=gut metagenome TaxID=749906 RepID=J9GH90_9ZZZZ